MPAPDPATLAERRVVTLYLLAFAVRPLESVEDAEEFAPNALPDRSPLYLSRSAVADDWSMFSNRVTVRNALGATAIRHKTPGRNRLFSITEEIAAEALASGLEQYRRLGENGTPPDPNDAAVATRHSGKHNLNLIRLRRDLDGSAATAWEELGNTYAFSRQTVDVAQMLAEARRIGFDVTSPIPFEYAVPRVTTDRSSLTRSAGR